MQETHAQNDLKSATVLDAAGITKTFLGARALDCVDFSIARGEVHGLVGKNGAGKSTLVKILAGAQAADTGSIRVGDQTYASFDPLGSRKAGIACVHQNAEVHLDLTVAANVFLGAEPKTRLGLIDEAEMARRTDALMAEIGVSVPPNMRLGDLDIAVRQQVVIAKAIREDAKVLLLDEPTAALNKNQTDFLFRLIRNLADKGMAVVYISHHLDEVLAISDRITVLRNGKKVGVVESKTDDKDGLISMIVGRALEKTTREAVPENSNDELLSVSGLRFPGKSEEVSLTLRRGEIIGLTGLIGSGTRYLAEVIAGVAPAKGQMRFEGAPYAPRSVREAIARGIVYIPEDMRERGLVMSMSVAGNITLAGVDKLSRLSWLDLRGEHQTAVKMSERLDLHPRDPAYEVRFLSGGNQRKALLGRAVHAGARLFVLDDPTQGVDVEAQRQIHTHLRALAEEGAGVIFLSTDLEELIALADRIIVMQDGGIANTLSPVGLTPERLLATIQNHSKKEEVHV